MFASKYLLCPLAGALALRAQRQILGGYVIFVARRSDGLAAEAEYAQWANAVADPSWCALGHHELLAPIRNLRLQNPVVCAKVNTNGKAGFAARLEPSAGSVVEHHVEQRTVNPQSAAVVVDEAQFAGLVPEEVDSGARRADDLRQHFLTHLRHHRLRFAGLPEVRQQQKHTRQPLLTGVEELVHQILFNTNVTGEQIVQE